MMKGSCLCGAVSVIAPETTQASACHCTTCRRWGGGPAMGLHVGAGVQVENPEAVINYPTENLTGAELFAKYAPGS